MVRRSTGISETAVIRRQRRWSATERAMWLERFERSGLSLRVFCRKHGVPISTLLFWRRRARGAVGRTAGVIEVPSAAVRAAAVSAAARGIAIRLPNHIELDVSDQTDPKWVAALLREARAGSGGASRRGSSSGPW
ncbi:MAG: IS66 family insertion sequence element accessory protein TnpA [Steroidobacteraceae bacterium]